MDPLEPQLVTGLRDADAYPGDPSASEGVEHVQTHLSHVFLSGARVYKLRKAVDLGFVDFGTRAVRDADCLREVELNRRLAPDVYLGVAAITLRAGEVRVGPVSQAATPGAVEHCVVMRRLPAGRDALTLLQRGTLGAAHVDAVAERIARFHGGAGLGTPAPFSAEEWYTRITDPARDNFGVLHEVEGRFFGRCDVARAVELTTAFARDQRLRFELRRRAGRAVDGHGDLHLQHIWFESDDAPPLAIDCLEFSDSLRRIDAAADVAFLAMDLRYRGRARWAERLLRIYARETDDFDLYGVIDYFQSYRAAVRAKVAAVVADDAAIRPEQRRAAAKSARRHLLLATRLLQRRRDGALVLLCGLPGTGKSSVAERIADELGAPIVASDRVRKRLAGLSAGERADADWESGLYTAEWTQAAYDALLERAEPVCASGRVAVLDATYARSALRHQAASWTLARGLRPFLVEVTCSREEALKRLARRKALAGDPSDAGPELYDPSARRFEAIAAWPAAERFRIQTDRAGWRQEARVLARRIRDAARSRDGVG